MHTKLDHLHCALQGKDNLTRPFRAGGCRSDCVGLYSHCTLASQGKKVCEIPNSDSGPKKEVPLPRLPTSLQV